MDRWALCWNEMLNPMFRGQLCELRGGDSRKFSNQGDILVCRVSDRTQMRNQLRYVPGLRVFASTRCLALRSTKSECALL